MGLSSEHHHALVLARTVTTLIAEGRADEAARQLVERFECELEPHFSLEEDLLLPALREVGEVALVERTEADHALLRAEAGAAKAGRTGNLVAFAERLTDHVRFEERELFPRCEATLPAAVLDAVGRRSPHGG